MAADSDLDPRGPLSRVKQQAAALLLGAPFYALVVVLLLGQPAETVALGLYGAGAGGWLFWQGRRALRAVSET